MAKKTVKISKSNKGDGFLAKELGGSLMDIMNNEEENNIENETVDNKVSTKNNKVGETTKIDVKEGFDSVVSSISKINTSELIEKLISDEVKVDEKLIEETNKMFNEITETFENTKITTSSNVTKRLSKHEFINNESYLKEIKELTETSNCIKSEIETINEAISINHESLDKDKTELLSIYLNNLIKLSVTLDDIMSYSKDLIDTNSGENKIDLIINELKYIKAAKDKKKSSDNEDSVEDDTEPVDISNVELKLNYEEFKNLYNNAKYKDCKSNVKNLAKLIKYLSASDKAIIANNIGDFVTEIFEDISSKEFISDIELRNTIIDLSDNRMGDIESIMKEIDLKLSNDNLDNNLRTILIGIKNIFKALINEIKNTLKELRGRNSLNIDIYISALKADKNCPLIIIKPMEQLIPMLPKELKCDLVIPNELAIAELEEDSFELKYMLLDNLLNNILSDKYIDDNIKLYPDLSKKALLLCTEHRADSTVKEIIENNKSTLIMQIIDELLFD